MAKSDRSPQNPQPPHHASPDSIPVHSDSTGDDPSVDAAPEPPTTEPPTGPESRTARLAEIRRKIDAGAYDSDELLEQALEIMIKRMSEHTE